MDACGFHFETTYTDLPGQFFTQVQPKPIAEPGIVVVNTALAEALGLDFSGLSEAEQSALFSGNRLPEGTTPFSQAYAGHQFGGFTILGDGRAHVWGEHMTPNGERFDIQFKGSGLTPYSRGGDGKAALGPMLREYIISEAMHHLGIPTTRSLAVVATNEAVRRETLLPGAILTRVAQSHLRVGTFQFAAYKQDPEAQKALMDYAIRRHYPELLESENRALALLRTVIDRQAELIVHWMRVGFIHGVMNTDNMTIAGQTIDYGPCAFMDAYDPATVFSSIDHQGRYAYANQPRIAQWNLARFAEALLPLINQDMDEAIEAATEEINGFLDLYQRKWAQMMRAKLGLFGAEDEDQSLALDLLDWMKTNNADYTNTFWALTEADMPDDQVFRQETFKAWYDGWQARMERNSKPLGDAKSLMKANNPNVIPRNHRVEEALEAAEKGDFLPFKTLLGALKAPYNDLGHAEEFLTPPQPSERVYQTFCGT